MAASATTATSSVAPATTSGDEPMEVNKIKARPLEPNKENKDCWRCGKKHGNFCRFRYSRCYVCKRMGHIAEVCSDTRDKGKSKESSRLNGLYEDVLCNWVSNKVVAPFYAEVQLDGRLVNLEVDCGAAYTMLRESTAREIWNGNLPSLDKSKVRLTTWTENQVELLGEAEVDVKFKNIHTKLNLLIARGNGPDLLGRDWFPNLGIGIHGINNVRIEDAGIDTLLGEYEEVFQSGLGKYTGPVVTIPLKPDAKPKFLKCRPVAFAIKERVLQEIDRLVEEDVLEPVSHSEFASPPSDRPSLKKIALQEYGSTDIESDSGDDAHYNADSQ
ncbi:uncharacterized protein LOC125239306 [Leguminivora glycinivorella]|nr:uncharacterized protein LOC125239306 [Leguminivora glycinivorella]